MLVMVGLSGADGFYVHCSCFFLNTFMLSKGSFRNYCMLFSLVYDGCCFGSQYLPLWAFLFYASYRT